MTPDEFDDRQTPMDKLRQDGVIESQLGSTNRLISAVRGLRDDRDQLKTAVQDLRARVAALEGKPPA